MRAAVGFTLGNLVVYRVGDGSASLGNTATAVFLDEYAPAGALVQSIAMPTTVNGSNKRLTASGSATTEGFLTRSTDGQYIVLTGYDAALTTAVTSAAASTVNRVVGRVDSLGSIDTTTALTDSFGGTSSSGGNIRAVASTDGVTLWVVGNANAVAGAGVRSATLGGSTATQVSATTTNLRQISIFGGQLYTSTASGAAFRVGAVGTGLPTTVGQTTASLPGLPTNTGSSNGIFLADLSAAVPGLDTLYVADDSASQLQKYSLVGGTWVSSGAITVSAARGLTGNVQGTTVTLFGTSGSAGTTLYSFTDSTGYNGAIAGATTTLASAGTNKAFRGVALAPSSSADPIATGAASPTSVQAGASTQLTVTVTPGTNPASSGLSVAADLTPIGGSNAQTFAGSGNSFSFQATVSLATTPGAKTLVATIADAQGRKTFAPIALTVTPASTPPTGVGAANPNPIQAGNSTLLTTTVTPGTNPSSTGITVTANLTSLGGLPAQQFFDDATNGDVTSGDNIFSFLAFVPTATTAGTKTVPVAISDSQVRSSTTSITLSVTAAPPPTNPTGTGSADPGSVQAGGSTTTTLTVSVTLGTNPTSTNVAVRADLSSIGLSSSQAFAGTGNTFTYVAAVPSSAAPGGKTLPVTITDGQGRTASTSIALTVTPAATAPTATVSAAPSNPRISHATLLTVAVTPGANPASTGLNVVGDLSAIGGSAAQQFFDDGTNGDVAAGNNIFSYNAVIPSVTVLGTKVLPITITDGEGRTGTATISLTIQGPPPPTTIKISQVYGGGGNSGATYTNDFIELYNVGSVPVDVTTWSVQYASATATAWSGGPGGNLTPLCTAGTCVIAPGHYFLVQEAPGTSGGVAVLPAADAVGNIFVSSSAAKVALVANTTPLAGACPVDDNIVDFVGYGNGTGNNLANCAETAPASTLGNTTAAVRRANGCVDTNDNSNDFVEVGPIPRNSSVTQSCGGDPTVPSGLGLALPSLGVEPSGEAILTVAVTPAATPPSTGLNVVADLTSIGGTSTQTFFDDGSHGDETAGDNVFTFQQTVPFTNPYGAKLITAVITDDQARSVNAPITVSVISPTCGVERWAVKVGSDSTVGHVDLISAPTLATIEGLGLIAPPTERDLDPPNPNDPGSGQFFRTRSEPIETTVFTVDATMTFYKKENDVDYHVVLDDGNGHTLIAEIPSPACILADGSPRTLFASPLGAGIANARTKFDVRLAATPSFQTANIPVRVTGVGFFDFEHGQRGVAPNAIELHPVLDISFRGTTTTKLESSKNPAVYGDTITLTATVGGGDGSHAPTGNVVFFDAGNSLTAAIDSNGQASFTTNTLTAGTHSITASYEGDDTSVPSSAPAVVEMVSKADQTIDFAPLDGKVYGDADFTVGGGSSSGLPVSYSIASGPATIAGATVHITGAGTVTVRASQSGDDNRNAALDVDQSFVVAQASQTISFGSLPDKTFGDAPFLVSAIGGASGNPVTFAASGACASSGVNGATTALTGIGPCTVTASQAGNANYAAAPDVPRTFQIFDRTPPVIASITPSTASLWPPNRRMVPVSVAVSVADNVDGAPACRIVGVTSNEGSGADWEITGPLTAMLRADRAGNGNGRMYVITVRCADASGNASTATTTVVVPHDQGK